MSVNLLMRKPGDKPAAYSQPAKQWQKNAEDTLRTSAHFPECSTSYQNLTIHSLTGWQSIHLSTHSDPDMPQAEVVQHFKSLKSGALIFNQSTPCRNTRTTKNGGSSQWQPECAVVKTAKNHKTL
jgi:hypothetical protein